MTGLFLIIFLTTCVLGQEHPSVCLDDGTCYIGSWMESAKGSPFASYQGIRYAEPPIGKLRFRPPFPFESNSNTFDVSQESTVQCPQLKNYYLPDGQEDCLLLNIYVPEKSEGQTLPVMFWIPGGELVVGSNRYGEYGPQEFMDRNVIIVTVNYRLGPFGFLSLGTPQVSGNAGFLDQKLALKWVNQNIEAFGGDKDSITIFGESAGALSVGIQLVSPMSEGLFQRAILQSSSTEAPGWKILNESLAIHYGNIFKEKLGCDKTTNSLECLQRKSMEEIINLTYQINTEGRTVWSGVPDNEFLPDNPTILLENGDFNPNVEVIISTTKQEGILLLFQQLADPSKWSNFRDNFDTIAPKMLFSIPYFDEITDLDLDRANKVFDHYIGSKVNIDEDHTDGIIELFTDSGFLFGLYKTANYLMKQNVKVYQAILTYHGEHSFTEGFGFDNYGICHGDDLFYLWKQNNVTLNENDSKVREIMTDAWTNFAKFGDPTPPGSEFSWLPVENPDFHKLWNISGAFPEMSKSQEIQDRMEFWTELLKNE